MLDFVPLDDDSGGPMDEKSGFYHQTFYVNSLCFLEAIDSSILLM